MILIALGANLPHPEHGTPRQTLEAALRALEAEGIAVHARSPWYASRPVPPSDQPWFVNGVAAVKTDLSAEDLLARLHAIEAAFGRKRDEPNSARVLDLDLLVYDDQVIARPGGLRLPHPRLAERAFVLVPLADVAPDWRHPETGRSVAEMLAALPGEESIERLNGE